MRPWLVHSLVVKGVHGERASQQLLHHGALLSRHAVGGLASRCVLAVLHEPGVGQGSVQVLVYGAAQGHGQHLYAAAYAQHGHLAVVGFAGQFQFKGIAHGVDAVQLRQRFLAGPQGVDVGPAREQQTVDALEQLHNVLVAHLPSGRNDERNAAGLLNGTEVAGQEFQLPFVEVARDAYHHAARIASVGRSGARKEGV